MENREEPVMRYPASAGFLRPPLIYNAPRRAHPPAAATTTTTPAAITNAANSSLAKPVDDAQVQPVGRGVKACGWVLLFVCVGVFAWACFCAYLTPKFKISSLSVSPFNSSSSSSILKAKWNITFSVRNPNYFADISYERIQVSVLYHGVPLSTASVAPFYQNGLLEANMEALSSPSADNDLVSSIDRDLQDGAVNFTVAVAGSFKYHYNLLSEKGEEEYRRPMTVSCDDVMVGLSGNKTAVGALVGGSRKCKGIDLLTNKRR